MDYTTIKEVALGYADRSDTQTVDNMDNFLRIVESKVNTKLKTMDKEVESTIATVAATLDYALPADYGGLRSIRHVDGESITPMKVLTPEMVDNRNDTPSAMLSPTSPYTYKDIGYYIKGGRIYIAQELTSGDIELSYYQQVPQLTSLAPNNWLSDDYPDCYVFGLVAEIKAWVKNKEGFLLWDARFKEAIDDIAIEDEAQRWSGNPMQMRTH